MDLAVIALSARPLAASAARAGFATLALDLLADLDTCSHAARCVRVHKRNGFSFDGDDLIQALEALSPPGLPVVLGSGFEGDTPLMTRIAARNPILGNMAETVRVMKDPLALQALCGHLGIPFPGATFSAPDGDLLSRPLLEKKIGGAGGAHIRRRAHGDSAPPEPGHYLQREVSGEPYAVLLISNGSDALVVGASAQWSDGDEALPFRFGGAAGPARLPPRHDATIRKAAQRLVTACGLVGLVSVDLVVDGDRWWLLEVNPRPGGSLELFDVGAMPPLLGLHLAACGGKLPRSLPVPSGVMAVGVLYAPEPVMIPDGEWPAEVRDRSAAGTIIPPGVPICTVRGTGATVDAARAQVAAALSRMRERFGLPQAEGSRS